MMKVPTSAVPALPTEQIDALLKPMIAPAERAQAVHQLNAAFFAAGRSFEAAEAMAQQACRPDVVTAACELLVSGDALGWTSLILLRYIGYCEGSCSLLVQQGVLAATVGTMRSWAASPGDHRTQLALELLVLLLGAGRGAGAGGGGGTAGDSDDAQALLSFARCGGCSVVCMLVADAPAGSAGAEGATRELALELLEAVSRGPPEALRHLEQVLARMVGPHAGADGALTALQPSALRGRYPQLAAALKAAAAAGTSTSHAG
jgi:hypothetical protein